MIDGNKTRKSLAGVEVQSPYVIKRRSDALPLLSRKKVNMLIQCCKMYRNLQTGILTTVASTFDNFSVSKT